MRGWDPAQWEMRWWLPLAGLAAVAGLCLERPEPGQEPMVDLAPAAAASCAELEDGFTRAACNAR